MANGEFEFGVSKHRWNDWCFLANALSDIYENIPQKKGVSVGRTEEEIKQVMEDLLEGRHPCIANVKPQDVVGGIRRGIIKTNESRGEDPGKVRRLDELARACNTSIESSIYCGGPMEWRKLYECALEAGYITSGPKGTFLDRICAED